MTAPCQRALTSKQLPPLAETPKPGMLDMIDMQLGQAGNVANCGPVINMESKLSCSSSVFPFVCLFVYDMALAYNVKTLIG